jgi:hypothetical protein
MNVKMFRVKMIETVLKIVLPLIILTKIILTFNTI